MSELFSIGYILRVQAGDWQERQGDTLHRGLGCGQCRERGADGLRARKAGDLASHHYGHTFREHRERRELTSCVTVELHTTVGSSGTSVTEYSTDGGQTWQVYTGGFSICNDVANTVSYRSTSGAGNVETVKTIVIKIDQTPPTITATVSPAAGANGWHNTDVTVTFTCEDATSCIAQCTSPVMVSTDGAGQMVTGTAVDNAGHSTSTNVTLNVDQTEPVIAIAGIQDGVTYELGSVPQASYTATDATSGVATSSDSLTGGDGLGLGVFTYMVTATDNAGNTANVTYTYEVIATPLVRLLLWKTLSAQVR